MLSGDNGILQKATTAKTNTDNAQIKEKIRLAYSSALTKDISDQKGEVQKSTFENELEVEFPNKTISIENSTDNKEWIVTIDGVTENVPIGNDTPKSNGRLASEIFEASGTTEGKMHVGDYVNYPVYYENVASNVSDNSANSDTPRDEYTGWRVLSIGGTGDSQYIRLVSAGVPLNYYHYNNAVTSVENLTTKFFSTPISSTLTQYNFYNCGFKTAQNGTLVANISNVMELFNNTYTTKYAEGESATYTDSKLNQTFTNSNVAGQPKVQSMTKADLDAVWGSTTGIYEDLISNDLLAIPCKAPDTSKYAMVWLASTVIENYLWHTGAFGETNFEDSITHGVRCVVTLNTDVKYSLAEGSNSTDTVKTWNLE